MSATITRGQSFATTEQITANKLMNLVDLATISGIVDAEISASAAISLTKLSVTTLGTNNAINIIIDGGGAALTTGVKLDVVVPFNCTITQSTLLADQSGSIVLDIWKDSYANYPPTVDDTITASAKPTLSSAIKAQDSTLTGWTTSITAGDTLRINIDSITTVTRVCLSLKVTRT